MRELKTLEIEKERIPEWGLRKRRGRMMCGETERKVYYIWLVRLID